MTIKPTPAATTATTTGKAVQMPNGYMHLIRRLFGSNKGNHKLAKTPKAETHILYLALWPHKIQQLAGLGNICPWASAECAEVCVNQAGLALFTGKVRDSILEGRLARRLLYTYHRQDFVDMWHAEMRSASSRALRKRSRLACRPNTFSDIDWAHKHPDLIEPYPQCQFYGYTKDQHAFTRYMCEEYPPNYYLTFSRSGTPDNESYSQIVLRNGFNLAVVFDTKRGHALPKTWQGCRVIDGDLNDLRYLDPRGVVVGLRAKGRAKGKSYQTRGFVVRTKDL